MAHLEDSVGKDGVRVRMKGVGDKRPSPPKGVKVDRPLLSREAKTEEFVGKGLSLWPGWC